MLEGLRRWLGLGPKPVPKRRRHLRVDPADALEWKRLYEDEGLSFYQIAERTGRNPSTIHKTLKYKLGVAMRHAGPRPEKQPARKRGPDNANRTAEMVRLRTVEYRTLDQIGDHYGITRERARQVLKAAGVDGRKVDAERRHLFAKKYQPKPPGVCPWCSEEYTNWLGHLRSKRGAAHRQSAEFVARDAAVAADYATGMKYREIMAKYDIDPASVSRSIKRHNVPLRRPRYVRLPKVEATARKASILRDLRQGKLTVNEIATKHLCSTAWVHMVGREVGLVIPRRKVA